MGKPVAVAVLYLLYPLVINLDRLKNSMKTITRRQALRLGTLAGASLLLPIGLQRIGFPPVLSPVRSESTTDYYEITMRKARVGILPGLTTEVWAYNGISPGPTIKQRVGRQSVVRFINNSVDTPTSVHLHGMASLPQYDGYAEDLIAVGSYKDYIYPNNLVPRPRDPQHCPKRIHGAGWPIHRSG